MLWGNLSSYSGFSGGASGKKKNTPANTGDVSLIPGQGRSPGGGNGSPFQFSCLENPIEESGGLQSIGLQRVGHTETT